MEKKTLQKVLMHLIKTRQSFCFGTSGKFYTIDDVMTKLYGRSISIDEALKVYK